jgi:hypothetical protein
MKVNRNNYEEFFLLYADDELNPQQRAEVELFVQQNPDMAAEMEIVQQMKLEPEDGIVFPDKSILFKTTDVDININNYEEFFLLYIDRELDAAADDKVEKFVLQHPGLQEEFTLLKQTVLQPEAITFADKSSLYRKEERKVGYLYFTRFAAAAALIGLVALGWWLYPKNASTDTGGIASTGSKSKQAVTPVAVESKKQLAETNMAPAASGVKETTVIVKNPATAIAVVKNSPKVKLQQRVAPIEDANTEVTTNSTKNDAAIAAVTIKPDPADRIAPPVIKTVTGNTQTDNPVATIEHPNKNSSDAPIDATAYNKPPVVTTVAYKELDTNDDDRSMYVGALELNKDKIKGFFKRAGRLFGARPKKETN